MITGIDHVAIMTDDFETTIKSYGSIFGRAPSWRDFTSEPGHAWFQLEGTALDIVGATHTGPKTESVHHAATMGLGFSVPDLDAATHLFERRGLNFLSRHMTRSTSAEGDEHSWEVATIKRESANGLALFLVERKPDAPSFPFAPASGSQDATVNTLDHIVVHTTNPERAVALFGGRLGLDLRLDRSNEKWAVRQLFFRCGNAIIEVGARLSEPASDAPDTFGGLAWRVQDPQGAQARIAAAGINVSEVRRGRKPGTSVFTVRDGTAGVPTLMLAGSAAE